MPTVSLVPVPRPLNVANTKATFFVLLQGMPVGQHLDISFYEEAGSYETGARAEKMLGTATGAVATVAGDSKAAGLPQFTLDPSEPPPPAPGAKTPEDPPPVLVAFLFPAAVKFDGTAGPASTFVFEMTGDRIDTDEGEWWEFCVHIENLNLKSRTFPVARIRRQLGGDQATYDWHDGHKLATYHDGCGDPFGKTGAFHDVMAAIDEAQSFIFIADWSFQPMFAPGHDNTPGGTIGAKLIKKAAAHLVAIHTWDHPAAGAADPQNDSGNDVMDALAGGTRPANLLWRASSHDQTLCSHHQKYVILDCAGAGGKRELKVFFGGLDFTQGRFDWGAHSILPTDPELASFRADITVPKATVPTQFTPDGIPLPNTGDRFVGKKFNDWYNAEFEGDMSLPRQPWHDIYGMLQGPAAWDFVREFVGRWNVDPSDFPSAQGNTSKADIAKVDDKFKELFDKAKFVQQWDQHDGPFAAQVYRSMFRTHWGESKGSPITTPAARGDHREFQWRINNGKSEQSIQNAYQLAIDQAEKFIYIETQYLIGSGARWAESPRSSIANNLEIRIVDRTIARIKDGVPFHTYIVMPMFPEGVPTSFAGVAQRQFEWNTVQYMAQTIQAEAVKHGKSWTDFLTFSFLANWHNVPSPLTKGDRKKRVGANQRYMIYVHSKLMIVDDRFILFGSANLNERSLAGDRDLEICAGMWPTHGKEQECTAALKKFRLDIWGEHFGAAGPPAAGPESPATVKEFQAKALRNYINFRELKTTGADGHICMWPFVADKSGFYVDNVSRAVEGDSFLPDSVYNEGSQSSRYEWMWASPGSHYAGFLAE